MANERRIRISTEFDGSAIIKGLNEIKQKMGSMSVDSNLFKDIEKDITKISKMMLEIGNGAKKGIPEKEVNTYLKKIGEVNNLYALIPEKLKQIQLTTKNINLSNDLAKQIDKIDVEIDSLKANIEKTLGTDLKTKLKNVIPQELIGSKAIESIDKADNKFEAFEKQILKLGRDADAVTNKIANIAQVADSKGSNFRYGDAIRAARNSLDAGADVAAVKASLNSSLQMNSTDRALNKQEYSDLLGLMDKYATTVRTISQLEATRTQYTTINNAAQQSAAQSGQRIAELEKQKIDLTNSALAEQQKLLNNTTAAAQTNGAKAASSLNNVASSVQKGNEHLVKQDSLLKQIASRATSLIGIGAIFNYITRGVREAWNGIKDLDKEFTQIAVVTDKTTSQLWQSFGTYSQMAQSLGVITKDAVATSALYYQQGLKTSEVMTLTAETIKMAQIAGMDFSTATNQMTAAIRGFNLEMEDASKVNDIFSTLAAHAAVSTQELSYALTKTASIADSAGMSIDTTSAFLTKMIETTREAPENIGTAMKSIIARFEELKKNPLALTVEVDGEEVVANKVEAAIALAGVSLRNASGQFRDLDQVFLELAKSWDGLDRNTQRYIATIAAGSRQQSRFIAMMEGYDRTLELVEMAQDSEGQSAVQFLKTLDSLDSKLNRITNSFEKLYQKFVNSDFFGGLLDGLNDVLQKFGELDAGSIATILGVGIVIGNTLIKGIKQATVNIGTIGSIIGTSKEDLLRENEKYANASNTLDNANTIANEKAQALAIAKANTASATLGAETAREEYIKSLQGKKYNIDTADAIRNISKLQNQLDILKKEIEEKEKLNINTIEAKKELQDLNAEADNLQNKINSQEDIIKNTSKLSKNTSARNSILAGKDMQNYNEALNKKEEAEQLETEAEKAAEKAKVEAEKAAANVKQVQKDLKEDTQKITEQGIATTLNTGIALVRSLTLGITMAVNDENPMNGIIASVSTLGMQMAPIVTNQISEVAKAIKTGKNVINAAGGWITLALEGIAIAISILGPLVANEISKIKTSSEQLEDTIKNLTKRQEELTEASERANAEAAVEKTKNKNLNNLVKTYDELIHKTGKTTDEQEKLAQTITTLGNDFPDLIDYYDEAGNAVLKQRIEWDKILEDQEASAKLAAQQAMGINVAKDLTTYSMAKANVQLSGATGQRNMAEAVTHQFGEGGAWGLVKDIATTVFNLANPLGIINTIIGGFTKTGLGGTIRGAWENSSKEASIQQQAGLVTDWNNKQQINNLKKSIVDINTQGITNTELAQILNLSDKTLFQRFSRSEDFQKILSIGGENLIETNEDYNKYIEELTKQGVNANLVNKLKLLNEETKEELINGLQNVYFSVDEQLKALNEDYQNDDMKQALEATRKDIQTYIINYIKSFAPELTEGTTEQGFQRIVASYTNQAIQQVEDLDSFVEKAGKNLAIILRNAGAKLNTYQFSKINKALEGKDSIDLSTIEDKETYDIIVQAYEETVSAKITNITDTFIEVLEKLKSDVNLGKVSEESYNTYLNQDYGNISLDELRKTTNEMMDWAVGNGNYELAQKIYDQYVEAEQKLIDNLGEGTELYQIGTKWGYNIAQGMIDQKLGEKVIHSINEVGDRYNLDENILKAVFSVDDWGNIEQLQNLSGIIYNYVEDTEQATKITLYFQDLLREPLNLNINVEQAYSDLGEAATKLQDLRKEFKDIKSAMDEYSKSGKLSGDTVLSLIENGQMMYLIYDEQTKTMKLNKTAMEDYYKTQIDLAKANLLEKQQEAALAIEELVNIKDNLIKKKEILVAAKKNEGKITGEQYKELLRLNTEFGNDEIQLTKLTNEGIENAAKNLFINLDGIYDGGFSGLIKNIKTNGAKLAKSMDLAMSGNYDKIDSSGTFNIDKAKEKMDNYLATAIQTTAYGVPSDIANELKLGEYKFDEATIDKMIAEIDEDIAKTDKAIEAKTKYYKLIGQGVDYYDALTQSGLIDFLNDTASSTEKASKALEEYLTKLEKYYNLNKEISVQEKLTSKAKSKWKETGLDADYKKYEEELLKEAELKGTRREYYKKERENDVSDLKTELGKEFPELAKLVELDKNGYLNEKEIYAALEKGGYNAEQGKAAEEIITKYENSIEKYTDEIVNTDNFFTDTIEELRKTKKDTEKIRDAMDRLKNIQTALDQQTKLLEENKQSNEDYYSSGGREGIRGLQYVKGIGESQQNYNIANNEYKKYQEILTKSINEKYKDNINFDELNNKYFIGDTKGLNKEQYETLEKLTDEYNKVTDKINENTKAIQSQNRALREWAKNLRNSYSKLVNQLADAMAKLDQQEIDEVKKKYAMIEEEDNKYLQSLQDSINKQRQLRDQAKDYDNLEKQEKRLALLQRDTSQANATEIAALEEQIKSARENLADKEQDNIINNISEDNKNRKEQMDEETKFLQNVMDERTYDMQYYIDKAQEIVNAAIDGDIGAYQEMLDILKKADEAFFKGTAEDKQKWEEEFKTLFTEGSDWREIVLTGMETLATGTIEEISDLVNRFVENDIHYISEISNKINELEPNIKLLDFTEMFKNDTNAVDDLINKLTDLENKIKDGEYDIQATIKYIPVDKNGNPFDPNDLMTGVKSDNNGLGTSGKYAIMHYDNEGYHVVGFTDSLKTAQTASLQGGQGYYVNTNSLQNTVQGASGVKVGSTFTGGTIRTTNGQQIEFSNLLHTGSADKYSNKVGIDDTNDGRDIGKPSNPTKPIQEKNSKNLASGEKMYFSLTNKNFGTIDDYLETFKSPREKQQKLNEINNWLNDGLEGLSTVDANNNNLLILSNNSNNEVIAKYISGEGFDGIYLGPEQELYYEDLLSIDSFKSLGKIQKNRLLKFATGGLNTQTGPAWLDGTPQNPEYVLDSVKTKAFLQFTADLAKLMQTPTLSQHFDATSSQSNSRETNIQMHINVENLNSDSGEDLMSQLDDIASTAMEGQLPILTSSML